VPQQLAPKSQALTLLRCATRARACPVVTAENATVAATQPQDLRQVLDRALAANVRGLIVTGTCASTSRSAQQLCERHGASQPLMRFTAGCHPHNAKVRPGCCTAVGGLAPGPFPVVQQSGSRGRASGSHL
jgi:Tat protein secretion system quality control protein TatD with DNase activity